MRDYKAAEIKQGAAVKNPHRKYSVKYNTLVESFKSKLGWGDFFGGKSNNLSGYEGDLGEVAELVKSCIKEETDIVGEKDLLAADAEAKKV